MRSRSMRETTLAFFMILENISDTARWIAVYRAMEPERPDAIFSDPFARRLAGERGEKIVHEMHRGRAAAMPGGTVA